MKEEKEGAEDDGLEEEQEEESEEEEGLPSRIWIASFDPDRSEW